MITCLQVWWSGRCIQEPNKSERITCIQRLGTWSVDVDGEVCELTARKGENEPGTHRARPGHEMEGTSTISPCVVVSLNPVIYKVVNSEDLLQGGIRVLQLWEVGADTYRSNFS